MSDIQMPATGPISQAKVEIDATSFGARSTLFANNAEVRRNEGAIWAIILDEVESIISHVSDSKRINVLEIGGASLEGLRIISQSRYFPVIDYSIVDPLPSPDSSFVSARRANYFQASLQSVSEDDIGRVDLVIAVRALEYDPDYGQAFRKLSLLSSDKCYGIFLHNAEDSVAINNVKTYRQLITLRLETIGKIRNALTSSMEIDQGSLEQGIINSGLDCQLVQKELRKLKLLLGKLSKPGSEDQALLLSEREMLYQQELAIVENSYGNRINSRRFWSNDSISAEYSMHELRLIQRLSVSQQSSRLSFYLDLVDITNPLKNAGRKLLLAQLPAHFDDIII